MGELFLHMDKSIALVNKTSVDQIRRNELHLPPNWLNAIDLIAETSSELGIPSVIGGSLGVAAACGISWNIARADGTAKDLDVFVMGDEQKRQAFHDSIQSKKNEEMPLIDSHMEFGKHFIFESGGQLKLKYKEMCEDVDPLLFKPIPVDIGSRTISVLHPQTYLEMLKIYNREFSPKIKERVHDLEHFISQGCPGMPSIQKNLFKPLIKLRKRLEIEHHLRQFRRGITQAKLKHPSIAKTVDRIHSQAPELWGQLKRLAAKEAK